MLLAPAGPGAFPPDEQLHVLALASSATAEHDQPDTCWTLDNLAYEILRDAHHRDMSRSTIARILNAADLKPHQSVYWLNSHDPNFEAKAQNITQLYRDAPVFFAQGRVVLSSDEKTGMQILQRKYPTQLAVPGHVEKREFEYIRHGTRVLMTTFCVPTGEIVWDLGPTRTSVDWVRHLDRVSMQYPTMKKFDWVVDNLNTHWSLEVCRWVAEKSGIPFISKSLSTGQQRKTFLSDPDHVHQFHFTPLHGSWLNQVELFFSVLSRRFLKRGDFSSAKEFEERIEQWLEVYNTRHAHPYRWTYTGEPLVRATPFSQTRRQHCRGRVGCGRRPMVWYRTICPPRPYQSKTPPLAKDL